MSAPFISADDLGAYLHQTVDPDDLLTKEALNIACQIVEDYLGYPVALEEDVTERIDGTAKDALLLPRPPIRAVTTVIESEIELTAETAPGDGGTFWLGHAGILYRVGCSWKLGRGNVVVTYDRGYDLDSADPLPVPDSIRGVALELAAGVYSAGNVGLGGVKKEAIGQYSYELGEGSSGSVQLSDVHKATLGPYRDWRVV